MSNVKHSNEAGDRIHKVPSRQTFGIMFLRQVESRTFKILGTEKLLLVEDSSYDNGRGTISVVTDGRSCQDSLQNYQALSKSLL